MIRPVLLIFFFLLSASSFAQQPDPVQDTVKTELDTFRIVRGKRVYTTEAYEKRFQPRKAILYAAVLPGMGQIYNKKYWKLPIVYGGFFLITSAVIFYNNGYQKYKAELFGLLQVPAVQPPSGYNEEQLRTLTDSYRRQRDFFLILDGMVYLLQLVDAHVDAHLRSFDMNPNLKVSVRPEVRQNYLTGSTSGFSVTFTF